MQQQLLLAVCARALWDANTLCNIILEHIAASVRMMRLSSTNGHVTELAHIGKFGKVEPLLVALVQ